MRKSSLLLAAVMAFTVLLIGGIVAIAMWPSNRERVAATEAIQAYGAALDTGAGDLRRTGAWPSVESRGVALSVEAAPATEDRMNYSVLATVANESQCQGVLAGGVRLAPIIRLGNRDLLAAEVMPQQMGGDAQDPTVALCASQRYPLTVRLQRTVEAIRLPTADAGR